MGNVSKPIISHSWWITIHLGTGLWPRLTTISLTFRNSLESWRPSRPSGEWPRSPSSAARLWIWGDTSRLAILRRNPRIFCIKWGVLPDSSKFQHHVWFDMVKPVTSRSPISIPLRRSGHPFSRHDHRLLPLWRGVGAGSVGLWRGGGAEGFPDFGPDACAQTGACLDFSIGSSSESPAWSPGLNQRTVECLA